MIKNNDVTINRATRTIWHRGKSHRFSPQRGRNIKFDTACHLLLGAGSSKEMLFWQLFGDDPEGGPLSGEKLIQTVIAHVSPDLLKIGIEIRSWRIAGVVFYCAVPTYEPNNPRPQKNARHVKRQHGPTTLSVANVTG